MTGRKYFWILWTALIIAVLSCLLWGWLDENVNPFIKAHTGYELSFYHFPMALVHFLLTLFIFVNYKKQLIAFLYLGFTFNNLADEVFFNPTKLQLNEFVFAILIVSFGLYRQAVIRRDSKTATYDDDSHNNNRYEADNRK